MAAQISPHLLGRPCGHPQGREELGGGLCDPGSDPARRWEARSSFAPSASGRFV